jgi:plasmid stabilization system protein ParE
MVNARVLVWNKIALDHLKEIYDLLKTGNNRDFAKEVKSTILKSAKELLENPYIYEQDRF